ncbi:MAG: type II toxin-antitoxin system RelE/ParE family toxin [Vulcanimicrobiota bacterium]
MSRDDEFAQFQDALMENPNGGSVMPGCGGLRKSRWAESARGKGKRSGLRIIYLHLEKPRRIYLITIYSKDEKEDLSADDKRIFRAISEKIQLEAQRKERQDS